MAGRGCCFTHLLPLAKSSIGRHVITAPIGYGPFKVPVPGSCVYFLLSVSLFSARAKVPLAIMIMRATTWGNTPVAQTENDTDYDDDYVNLGAVEREYKTLCYEDIRLWIVRNPQRENETFWEWRSLLPITKVLIGNRNCMSLHNPSASFQLTSRL